MSMKHIKLTNHKQYCCEWFNFYTLVTGIPFFGDVMNTAFRGNEWKSNFVTRRNSRTGNVTVLFVLLSVFARRDRSPNSIVNYGHLAGNHSIHSTPSSSK